MEWEKATDWGQILVAQQGALDEIHRLREENDRLKADLSRTLAEVERPFRQRIEELEREIDFDRRDPAHANCRNVEEQLKRQRDVAEAKLAKAEAEVAACDGHAYLRDEIKRLEELILRGWDEGDATAYADLIAETNRIRAAKERGLPKAHESDCPCVMCDPMQVRLSQQLRAQREERCPYCANPIGDGSGGTCTAECHAKGE